MYSSIDVIYKLFTCIQNLRFLFISLIAVMVFLSNALGQVSILTASDGKPDDNFAYALALSGQTLVAGAWQNDSLRANSGAAYVFEQTDAGTWEAGSKLMPDDADFAGDEFGKAVAIDGNWIIVGAQFDDTAGKDRGAAYVFERTPDTDIPWTLVAKLSADDNGFRDFFGRTVAISGTYVAVGAPEDSDINKKGGSVYIFERNESTATWTQVAKLVASDGAANDAFGSALSLSGDTLIVGAIEHNHMDINNNGAAYVFERNADGSWAEVAKLTASDGDELDYFGFSIALQGDIALIGTPFDDDPENAGGSAYLYKRSEGSWNQLAKLTASTPHLGNKFGHSVALSGELALVGSPGQDNNGKESGAAYLFRFDANAGSWRQIERLTASDGTAFDLFGSAVSLNPQGIFIGAHEADHQGNSESGLAYVFPSGF